MCSTSVIYTAICRSDTEELLFLLDEDPLTTKFLNKEVRKFRLAHPHSPHSPSGWEANFIVECFCKDTFFTAGETPITSKILSSDPQIRKAILSALIMNHRTQGGDLILPMKPKTYARIMAFGPFVV